MLFMALWLTLLPTWITLMLLEPIKCEDCNATVGTETETFLIVKFNYHCYLFGTKEMTFLDAYYFCARIKGALTDVDEHFELLKQRASKEFQLNSAYWTGLFSIGCISPFYVWASGNKLRNPSIFKGDYFGSCVKYYVGDNKMENVDCTQKNAPICILQTSPQEAPDNETSCSHVCQSVQENYGEITTTSVTEVVTQESSEESLNTTTTVLPNLTASHGNSTSKGCMCSKSQCDNEDKSQSAKIFSGQEAGVTNLIPMAVLAAVLAVSVLINAVTSILLFRTKYKNHSDMETHKPISMVDILSVDSSNLNQANANQETRVAYDIYTDPESPGYQDMEPKMSNARNITSDVSKGASIELDSQTYTHLDRDGAHKVTKASEERNVYGHESVMAATSKSNQDLGIALKQENPGDALNVYSNYDSSL